MKLTMFFGALLLSSAPAFANTNTWNAGFFRWPKSKVAVSYKVMNDNNTSFVIGFIMPESTSADGMLIPSIAETTCRNKKNWKSSFAANFDLKNRTDSEEVKIVKNIVNAFCLTHEKYYSNSPYYD